MKIIYSLDSLRKMFSLFARAPCGRGEPHPPSGLGGGGVLLEMRKGNLLFDSLKGLGGERNGNPLQ